MIDHLVPASRLDSTSTGFAFDRVSSPTLRRQIADKIRLALLEGRLREGEKLVERKLAHQFAASLTAVREALVELETEGFVVKKPNAATHVTKLSIEYLGHMFAVRRLLEGEAVERAASFASPQDIAELEQRFFDLLAAARSSDKRLFMQKDYALHERIWQAGGNEYLTSALRRVVLPMVIFCADRLVSSVPFDQFRDAQAHLPILEAIKAREPKAASEAYRIASEEWSRATHQLLSAKLAAEPEAADH